RLRSRDTAATISFDADYPFRCTSSGPGRKCSIFSFPWFADQNMKERMAKNFWLVKQEPEAYSWLDFVKDGKTSWTGVRNFAARNHLRAMKKGDVVFFYHSVSEKQVVGIALVERDAFPDPTAEEGDWSAVDLIPCKPLKSPVTLETI